MTRPARQAARRRSAQSRPAAVIVRLVPVQDPAARQRLVELLAALLDRVGSKG